MSGIQLNDALGKLHEEKGRGKSIRGRSTMVSEIQREAAWARRVAVTRLKRVDKKDNGYDIMGVLWYEVL